MSVRYRAIVVDDERLARNELISLLDEHDCVEVVGEAEDVSSAAEAIRALRPDVVFLDIQMPGESGFGLLNSIDVDCDIIFTTAFDEYAIRAFDVNALDYLLKPIHPERLSRAIKKLDSRTRVSSVPDRYRYSDIVVVSSGGRMKSIRISEIVLLQASGDYVEVLTSGENRILVHRTMMEWERRLPEDQFYRIHRSMIVNLEYVARFEESPKRHYRVYMKNDKGPFQISRRCASKLRHKLP